MNPIFVTAFLTVTFAQGGAMILNQDALVDGRLLIPLSIWVAGIAVVARASWVISGRLRDLVNRLDSGAERMKRIEERLARLEDNRK